MKFWNRFGVTVVLALGFFMGVVLTSVLDNGISLALADHRDPDIFVHVCVKRSGETKIADSFDECKPNDNAIALTSEDGYNELMAAILAEQAAREEAIAPLQASQESLAAEVAELRQALANEQEARKEADATHDDLMAHLFDVFRESIVSYNEDKAYYLKKLAAYDEIAKHLNELIEEIHNKLREQNKINKAIGEYLDELRNTCIEELDICPFQSLPPLRIDPN